MRKLLILIALFINILVYASPKKIYESTYGPYVASYENTIVLCSYKHITQHDGLVTYARLSTKEAIEMFTDIDNCIKNGELKRKNCIGFEFEIKKVNGTLCVVFTDKYTHAQIQCTQKFVENTLEELKKL